MSGPSAWRAIRLRRFALDSFTCAICGSIKAASNLEAHHISGLSGDYRRRKLASIEDLQTCCVSCHLKLHMPDEPPERRAWVEYVKGLSSS